MQFTSCGPDSTAEFLLQGSAVLLNYWPQPILQTLPIAVMPTAAVGGTIAIFALLFPALCGGLMIFLKRWRTVLAVLSACSTFVLLHTWYFAYVFDSWWESQLELWFCLAIISLLGFLSERQNSKTVGMNDANSTSSVNSILLGSVSAICLMGLIWSAIFRSTLLASYSKSLVVVGISAATGFCHARFHDRKPLKNCLLRRRNTQSVVLLMASILCIFFLGMTGIHAYFASSLRLRWSFMAHGEGAMYSSPTIIGDRVFVAASLNNSLIGGALYCLDGSTGDLKWTFNDEGKMKQVLSSPCHSGDRIYIGEGLHSDVSCKIYCVSATSGKKIWDFETASHTESTPNVVNGRVYFGAGDDGLYCLDSQGGELKWHFAGPHVDGCPEISKDRVYAGSGYGECEVFCVDATQGKPIWRVPVELSSFGAPTVSNENAFFGIGNGNFVQSNDNPAGALLCLDCVTGKIKWRHNVGDAVHSKPLVAGNQVYFVSRDRHCYCVEINTGKRKWKRDLGSPIIAAPLICEAMRNGTTEELCILTQDGHIASLNLETGLPVSMVSLSNFTQASSHFISTPAHALSRSSVGRNHQLLIGGASQRLVSRPTLFCFE